MQFELTRVNFGEEITPQPGHEQKERSDAGDKECPQESTAVVQATLQQFVIAVAELLKALFEANLHLHERISAGRRQMPGFMLVAA